MCLLALPSIHCLTHRAGYISRSVAGSYDNEGIAIFALIFTFYLWLKAVNTGAMYWGAMCALAYFYMVSAWYANYPEFVFRSVRFDPPVMVSM